MLLRFKSRHLHQLHILSTDSISKYVHFCAPFEITFCQCQELYTSITFVIVMLPTYAPHQIHAMANFSNVKVILYM